MTTSAVATATEPLEHPRITRIRNGDPAELSELYRALHIRKNLIRLMYMTAHVRESLDDVMHDIYVSVVETIHRRNDIRDLDTWLTGVCRIHVLNKYICQARHTRLDNTHKEKLEKGFSTNSIGRSPEDQLQDRQMEAELTHILEELKHGTCMSYRTGAVIWEMRLAGMEQPEIMEALGIDDTQYRLRQSRTKSELQRRMKKYLKCTTIVKVNPPGVQLTAKTRNVRNHSPNSSCETS